MKKVRVRFAPSPTGPLHIGGARSALFNYLFAKGRDGDLVLRIEDTDQERSNAESEENILSSLKWLGITWDEGPDKGGPYGPYRQTERLSIYQEFTERLFAEGKVYHCFCTEEELEEERKDFFDKGEIPRYSGKCRHLTEEEKSVCLEQGRVPTVRFHVPQNQDVLIRDLVRGDVVFESNGIGDFVIVKSDGFPTYNYAVVIDDSLMEISHVIRAEEHLSNTPRQILLYQALGFEEPLFAHVSLILGTDRTKMSKRHGATSVVQYRELGYLPDAIVNFLALLGWSPVGEEEVFSMPELVQQFSLERVAKNPAVFDMDKLKWLNGLYIRNKPSEYVGEMVLPFLQKAGHISQSLSHEERAWLELLVVGLQDHLTTLGDIVNYVSNFVGEEVSLEKEEALLVLREETYPEVARTFRTKLNEMPELSPVDIKGMLKSITKELKLGGKQVFMPLRIAITGQMHGPDLHYIIPILGREITLKRMEHTARQAGVEIQ